MLSDMIKNGMFDMLKSKINDGTTRDQEITLNILRMTFDSPVCAHIEKLFSYNQGYIDYVSSKNPPCLTIKHIARMMMKVKPKPR